MSSSILSTIAQSLSMDDIAKMAAAAGIAPDTAKSAVDAGVPAILSALTASLAKPLGAQQLTATLARQPAGRLETLAGALEGAPQIAQAGSKLLTSLMGAGSLAVLVSSLAKFIGVPEGSARSLLNTLMPAIMWVLGKERRDKGIGAAGLVDMLKSEKEDIAAAVPSGLSELLRANGFYDRLRISAPLAAEAALRSAYSAVPATENAASRSAPTWPFWIFPLLAVAGLAWYFLADGAESVRVSEGREPATKVSTQPAGSADPIQYLAAVPDNAMSIELYRDREVFNRTGEKVGSVTDLVIDGDGKIAAAIVSVGSFLGLGEKQVAMPFSALRRRQNGNVPQLVIDAGRGQLHAAPPIQAFRDQIRSGGPDVKTPDLMPAGGKQDSPAGEPKQ
jgi:sporulation protein YlmC with PRC-barrel domain